MFFWVGKPDTEFAKSPIQVLDRLSHGKNVVDIKFITHFNYRFAALAV